MTSWNVGVNFHPTDVVVLRRATTAATRYGSFQLSRNANPPPDPTWTDPSRDWTLDNDDTINNASVYLDLLRAVRNTDIRFAYDFSDSDNSFVHGGPRIAALACAQPVHPAAGRREHVAAAANADVQYFFTSRAGIGVGYYFEKLDIVDFNTIDTNGPVGFAPATGDPRHRLARRSDHRLRQSAVHGPHRVRARAVSLLTISSAAGKFSRAWGICRGVVG